MKLLLYSEWIQFNLTGKIYQLKEMAMISKQKDEISWKVIKYVIMKILHFRMLNK